MKNCKRKIQRHRRERCQPLAEKPNAELELRLLRVAVATLQEAGLMNHDVLDQAEREWGKQMKPPRA